MRAAPGVLARAIGVDPRSLARWEAGKSRPRARHAQAMVAFFAVRDARLAARLAAALGQPMPPMRAEPTLPVATLDAATLLAADALDVPASRLRTVLSRWLRVLVEAGFDARTVADRLESRVAELSRASEARSAAPAADLARGASAVRGADEALRGDEERRSAEVPRPA